MGKCKACPFNEGLTDEADYAQNMGCLPSHYDIVQLKRHTGHNWACHDEPTKICSGLVQHSVENKLDFDFKSGDLVMDRVEHAHYWPRTQPGHCELDWPESPKL